jgi:hypothetical protein
MPKAKPYLLSRPLGQPRRYAVYELLQDGIPVMVAWGPTPAPHLLLWAVRQHLDDAPIGRWLKYLPEPPALGWFHAGFLTPISRQAAEGLAKFRIAELRDMGIELPYNPPRNIGARLAVLRVWPDGRRERYGSVKAASRATGISRRQLMRHVDSGHPDDTGGVWVAI